MQCRVIVQRYIESALNGAALSGVLLYFNSIKKLLLFWFITWITCSISVLTCEYIILFFQNSKFKIWLNNFSLMSIISYRFVSRFLSSRTILHNKNRTMLSNNISARINMIVMGNGAMMQPSVIVTTDKINYLFNCGEGTQRMIIEHNK